MKIGIEKIAFYPGTAYVDFSDVIKHRDESSQSIIDELMVKRRNVLPLWEDPVTMSINACLPLLNDADKAAIDLVISATESGVDQEKPISSWLHRFLNLKDNCRSFEIKCACYCCTAAIKMAAGYLMLPGNANKKVLIVASDQSTIGFGGSHEYVLGAGAVAMLISTSPNFLELELDKYGIYTQEVSDIFRPLPWVEAGDAETSLFSYLESLGECFEDYSRRAGDKTIQQQFKHLVFHVPFPGLSYRAHHFLYRNYSDLSKSAAEEAFHNNTMLSLKLAQEVGGIYSAAAYLALISLIYHAASLTAGDRVGIFSYGSGSCAEFYSGLVGINAKASIMTDVAALIENRKKLTPEQYHYIEETRSKTLCAKDLVIDKNYLGADFFKAHYVNKPKVILNGVSEYYRRYQWGDQC